MVRFDGSDDFVVEELGLTGHDKNRGLVATFQAFQKGLGAYLATRLLLGYELSPLFPALAVLFN